jgi:pimeloyl-ACP methyl ester carboxylesterase
MRNLNLLVIFLICVNMLGCSSTSKIIDSQTPDKTISSLEFIQLNGAKQCLMIRSYNIDNPIIIYLHGGPGTSELPLIRQFNSDLEKHFTIVYIEQRGTGKSFNKKIFTDSLCIQQFVDDGFELTKYLLNRFHKEKLFIMGHSWGTVISTKLIFEHPELFYAYVGIGQEVQPLKGEQISYNYALSKAIETKNINAIKELKQINMPTYLSIDNNPKWYKQLKTERKWVTYFGGVIYNQKDYSQITKIYLKSREYNLFDMIRFGRGSISSLKSLWPELMKINLLNSVTNFEIPVYLVQGKYDYNCPTELVDEYFEKITAPKKDLILFENSSHNPNFEENVRFNSLIVEILKTNE